MRLQCELSQLEGAWAWSGLQAEVSFQLNDKRN